MREVEREKTVKFTVYISDDGKEFFTSEACLAHEKAEEKKRKEHPCPKCHGRGYFERYVKCSVIEPMWKDLDDGMRLKRETCPACDGLGYII